MPRKQEAPAVDLPLGKATPLEPGEPVEAPALSQLGGTFAERAKAAKKTTGKAVKADTAEDKSVTSSQTRRKS